MVRTALPPIRTWVSDSIVNGKPEASNLGPTIFNLRVADPEGRILGGLALHAGNGEIPGVDPKFPAVKILALALGAYGKNIEVAAWRVFGPGQREIVVLGADFQFFPVLLFLRFLFAAEQL